MKRLLSVLLAGGLICSLAACSGSSQTSTTTAAATTAAATEAAAQETPAATATSDEKVNIVFGIVDSEEQATYKAAVKFKEAVEAESNGNITIDIYPNGTLGGDTDSAEGVSQGTMQMACPVTSAFTAYDDKWGIFDMPFIFDSAEICFKAMDGELGQELAKTLDSQNIKILGYAYNGARSVTNNKRPINTPDDLAGIKIRVMESPTYIDLFNTLGANATPMAYSELFTGLQQNTVDAEENSPDNVYKAKFYEVQKYYSLTEHVHSPFGMIISKDFYEGLPADYQQIIDTNAKKYLVDWEREEQLRADESSLEELKKIGMEVNEITPENLQLFKDKLAPMYEKYESVVGKDILDLARSYN